MINGRILEMLLALHYNFRAEYKFRAYGKCFVVRKLFTISGNKNHFYLNKNNIQINNKKDVF